MIIPEANRLNHVGEYYFSRKLQQIREMQAEGARVINLGIGNPDLQPDPLTIAALKESAHTPGNHGYQSYRGIEELRMAISKWMGRTYDLDLDPKSQILPLMGSKEGIMHISMAFLNPGDGVLVPDPGYPTYGSVSKLLGAQVMNYPLDPHNSWAPDFDALEKADLDAVKIMWINYPNMPTGSNLEPESYERLIKLAREKKFLLVNDNPYSLILNPEPTSLLQFKEASEVCLELNSLSKSHNMAGWRLGWVAGKKEYIDAVLKVKSNFDSGMFLPIQHAAIQALNLDENWHKSQNQHYQERRHMIWEIMDQLNFEYSTGQVGMFVWARVPQELSSVESFLDELLHESHVFITPGFIFGKQGERYVRASLCNPGDVLHEAKQRIKLFNYQTDSTL